MELFATKGYAATTVDEIAATAGVARRTFFRHFRSKEEAIFPDHDDTLERAKAVLDAAPAHENPLDTVCRGIKEVMKMYASSPKVSVERYQLTREVPALREREIASVARYERLFTRYLLGHFDESAPGADGEIDEPLLAEVAASAVVTAHNHVLRRWLRAGGQGDVEGALDRAFAVVRRAFGDLPVISGRPPRPAGPAEGEVLVTVTRTDASLPEVMRLIEQALARREEAPSPP
ncbi:DNA-binding transcriptional regulator, AcrR family [Streptomyces aidingensis]|uniref:DNA-binding transcriptional regulator, AcrR family n=2 Tax=Streptomyces aidingensis TaxID=910347 RepID=A0A1I1J187_9ACTN|nr:DNA-binding transcriptional regulator, AcrR family [Streptomyces aidingensis]